MLLRFGLYCCGTAADALRRSFAAQIGKRARDGDRYDLPRTQGKGDAKIRRGLAVQKIGIDLGTDAAPKTESGSPSAIKTM